MMQTGTMSPDTTRFAALTDPYRTELLVHCYRMLGSVHEAEDLVQETFLRAWRSFGAFEGRSSVRTYLYRIATNACLTALEQRSRRIMPSAHGFEPGEPSWLEPIPDALLARASDPAAVVDTRASVRLAFIAALQHLPPIRRAVLILRDVLSLSAAEAAEVLDTTTAAVNSALPRARAQIAQVAPIADKVVEPAEPRRRALLDHYVAAFETADIGALTRLMRADIALEMPPQAEWFRGRSAVAEFFATRVLRKPGRFSMVPTAANGQPAVMAYLHEDDGTHRPHAVHVLTMDTTGLAHIAVFFESAVHTLFTSARLP
ncbi:RNA polymerase subunit sigma-70 [Planotetraspora mira]